MTPSLAPAAIVVAVTGLLLVTPAPAAAHVCLEFPLSRVGQGCTPRSPQKVGPCGVDGRSANVTTFRPGETITLVLNETVDHPSHYRVAFDPDGDRFVDPTTIDDRSGRHPYVLLDGIVDAEDARQSIVVTLPDVATENGTLQLIQVMHDKQANGFGGRNAEGGNDDIYYACADVVLRGESAAVAAAGEPREEGGAPEGGAPPQTTPAAPASGTAVRKR